MISVLILPDFTKQLEIEAKIQELKDSKMLMSVETPFCSCCLPSKYKDQAVFELEMERLENQQSDETLKPFVNSGHAFICFDSVASLNIILKHFRMTPFQSFKIFCISIKDKATGFWKWMSGQDSAEHQLLDSRGRSKSTFQKETETQQRK